MPSLLFGVVQEDYAKPTDLEFSTCIFKASWGKRDGLAAEKIPLKDRWRIFVEA